MAVDSMLGLAQEWAKAYAKVDPNATMIVKSGGPSGGIDALIDKQATFANTTRELTTAEDARAQTKGVNASVNQVAFDGIVVIVNKSNPVSNITKPELIKIYSGKIANWKDLGGPDASIVLVGRDVPSNSHTYLQDEIIGGKSAAQLAHTAASDKDVVAAVAQDPNALGSVGLASLNATVKALKADTVAPSFDTFVDLSYPLSRPVDMISNGDPVDLADAYMQWILGPDGQAIAKARGYVPLGE